MMKSDSKQTHYIDSQQAFADCMAGLAAQAAPAAVKKETGSLLLALDTEFERVDSFYQKIGLLQLATESHCYLIDPLQVSDWQPFIALLRSPSVRFIVHSASEDLNLLLCSLGHLPCTLIDTQIAAALLGKGFSLSYQSLVENLLGVALEKGETRSDWLRRPLSQKQLHYAALDVMYLHEAWHLLQTGLEEKGRMAWLQEDCTQALQVAASMESPARWQEMYTEVSGAGGLSDKELKTLQRLCLWRETTARRRDRPRPWIAKDAELIALARYHHQQPQQPTCPGINKGLTRAYNRELKALLDGEQKMQITISSPADRGLLKRGLPRDLNGLLRSCQRAVAARAAALGLPPEMLGRRRHLEQLLQEVRRQGMAAWPGVFAGWRAEVLAADLQPLLQDLAQDLTENPKPEAVKC